MSETVRYEDLDPLSEHETWLVSLSDDEYAAYLDEQRKSLGLGGGHE